VNEEPYAPPGELPEAGPGSKVALLVVAAIAGLCLLAGLAVVLLLPLLTRAGEGANLTRCNNTLRQLGLGAVQYSADKRFFPHVTRSLQFDGDAETNHGPKAFRALRNLGYVSHAELFVCPSSQDHPTDLDPRDHGAWFWGGRTRRDPTANPLTDGQQDPTLLETDELSYGWTRRAYPMDAPSNTPLAADRAVRGLLELEAPQPGQIGNHHGALLVVYVDARVNEVRLEGGHEAYLELLDLQGGALGLVPPGQ